ncbi:hypothetical protein N836_23125 [Leptolyngbya sp. Heron Island J]|nr:hypothetical protein N836_23125 [Leptolyngbya sp. Heron Island J]
MNLIGLFVLILVEGKILSLNSLRVTDFAQQVLSYFKVVLMFGQSVNLPRNSSEMGFGDNFLSSLIDLIMNNLATTVQDCSLREKLNEIRKSCDIQSPLDDFIEENSKLDKRDIPDNIFEFLGKSIKELKEGEENSRSIILDILKGNDSRHRKVFSNQKPSSDINQRRQENIYDYWKLIEYSAIMHSTALIDSLGIYGVLENGCKPNSKVLADPSLGTYIKFFKERYAKVEQYENQPENSSEEARAQQDNKSRMLKSESLYKPYYKYLFSALEYIASL